MSSSGETPFRGGNLPCGLGVLGQRFDFLLFIFPLELKKDTDFEHTVFLLSQISSLSWSVTASDTEGRGG